jgi:N-methylhydantoinase A
MNTLSLGIDIGGTFTDLVAFDHATGQAFAWKESTTPDDPARGVMAGVAHLLRRHDLDPAHIQRTVHATTLFTNALIERRGARVGLITTAGFRDVLEIGRERKYELYDIFIRPPAPLVPRAFRCEVRERLGPDGAVEEALDEAGLLEQVQQLIAAGMESLAVVFLHAHANPAHERQAEAAIARHFPTLPVSLSSEIAPEIGEYVRASTTAANAYVRPLAEAYLDRLEAGLRRLGFGGGFFLMLSNGGLASVAEAKRAPVHLLESGPAAGALAGAWFGRRCGENRVLAFDMGGTTAKLALVDDGEPLVAWGFEAAREKRFLRGSGLPIRIAAIELIEIGAGGGSLARRSELATLQVGPQSAGAVPGPACYGRGGTEPTVTDADLALGYLGGAFLGGAMPVDAHCAWSAIGTLATALDVSPEAAAGGIHEVVNEMMAGAARVAISEHGRVPSEYALLATGGAGPVHAWQVARRLGVRRLICPPGAGVGSAIGMLMAPARVDRAAAFQVLLSEAVFPRMATIFAELAYMARAVIAPTGADLSRAREQRIADMRYVGQGFETSVLVPDDPNMERLRAVFETTYRSLYGRTPEQAIQIVALRLSLSAPMPGSETDLRLGATATAGPAGERNVWFPEAGGAVPTQVFARACLPAGTRITGPAVLEEDESTFIIGPGGVAIVQHGGSIVVDMPA